ncbi:MAG TPA: hypothetical protein VF528_14215 [Pyrinomonadaceae bacterium]|jgi:hypothetical protein
MKPASPRLLLSVKFTTKTSSFAASFNAGTLLAIVDAQGGPYISGVFILAQTDVPATLFSDAGRAIHLASFPWGDHAAFP